MIAGNQPGFASRRLLDSFSGRKPPVGGNFGSVFDTFMGDSNVTAPQKAR